MQTKNYKLGLVMGRFQPFHLGHLHVVKFGLQQAQRVVVCIGSAQESATAENPLDAQMRMRIIEAALRDGKVDQRRVILSYAPDFKSDEDWYNYINQMHRGIDVVVSGNKWVQDTFAAHGVGCEVPPPYNIDKFSGTKLRERITKGQKWEHLLTSSAAALLREQKEQIEVVCNPKRITRKS